jgi:hypothetical protein
MATLNELVDEQLASTNEAFWKKDPNYIKDKNEAQSKAIELLNKALKKPEYKSIRDQVKIGPGTIKAGFFDRRKKTAGTYQSKKGGFSKEDAEASRLARNLVKEVNQELGNFGWHITTSKYVTAADDIIGCIPYIGGILQKVKTAVSPDGLIFVLKKGAARLHESTYEYDEDGDVIGEQVATAENIIKQILYMEATDAVDNGEEVGDDIPDPETDGSDKKSLAELIKTSESGSVLNILNVDESGEFPCSGGPDKEEDIEGPDEWPRSDSFDKATSGEKEGIEVTRDIVSALNDCRLDECVNVLAEANYDTSKPRVSREEAVKKVTAVMKKLADKYKSDNGTKLSEFISFGKKASGMNNRRVAKYDNKAGFESRTEYYGLMRKFIRAVNNEIFDIGWHVVLSTRLRDVALIVGSIVGGEMLSNFFADKAWTAKSMGGYMASNTAMKASKNAGRLVAAGTALNHAFSPDQLNIVLVRGGRKSPVNEEATITDESYIMCLEFMQDMIEENALKLDDEEAALFEQELAEEYDAIIAEAAAKKEDSIDGEKVEDPDDDFSIDECSGKGCKKESTEDCDSDDDTPVKEQMTLLDAIRNL